LGSQTVPANNDRRVQINSPQGVANSASKLRMKTCFERAGVKHSPWISGLGTRQSILDWASRVGYPVISKSHNGSRGRGNTKHDDRASLERFINSNGTNNYIFEKFIPYSREYRLHISDRGCFYTCRKLVRNDAPDDTWQRHDDVCSWILEDNPSFKKPNNWNAIVADCVRAKNALGLDICAFDVMVEGASRDGERRNPEWIICESCSAPRFGEITGQKYTEEIINILNTKSRGNGERR
jgi:glutathione synthase/RimK-type ligase-like ATP-grasp enzyme